MNDEGVAFSIGVLVGIIGMALIGSLVWESQNNACAKKHDVYKCEAIYIPITES